MDRRDYNNNMGPRLDLGLKPNKPAASPQNQPAPYRRQPAPPYHQENQQADPDPHYNDHYLGQQAPPYEQPGTFYDSRQNVYQEQYVGEEQRFSEQQDRRAYQQPLYDNEPAHAPGGVMISAPAKPGLNRWLGWLALAVALLALIVSLTMGRMQSANQATLQMDSELVPGATQERVAKLEKDVSSLLLKAVTLEKDLEAIKNRSWNPAALGETNNKISALQKQVKELESKLASLGGAQRSASAAANTATTATSTTSQTPPPASSAATTSSTASPNAGNVPVANSEVQARAGDKPDPLATRMGETSTNSQRQPRDTYKVQRGDTLFSVAQRYQVTTKDLLQWNNMQPDEVLKAGRTLIIY